MPIPKNTRLRSRVRNKQAEKIVAAYAGTRIGVR